MPPKIASTRRDLPRNKGYRTHAESYILDLDPCCPDAELADAYLRISLENQQKTEQVGISTQTEMTLNQAHKDGRCLRRIYVDDDVSASKPRLIRAAFTQHVRDLEAGPRDKAAYVYVQHQDRYYRQMKDLVSIGEINDSLRPVFLRTRDRLYELSNDDDFMILELSAMTGRREVRGTARRLRDARRSDALNGRMSGGPRRFGWDATPDAYHDLAMALDAVRKASPEAFAWLNRNSVTKAFQAALGHPEITPLIDEYRVARARVVRESKLKVSPFEAELIRDAHRRLLENTTTVNFLAKEWTLKGIRGAQGGMFEYSSLVRVLESVALAGFRTYKDEPALDATGSWIRGPQDAIVSQVQILRVRAIISAPPAAVRYDGGGQRKRLVGPRSNIKRLLSGLARCGSCGGPLYFSDSRKALAKGTATVSGTYRCFAKSGQCPKGVTATAGPLEIGVLTLVGNRLATATAPVEVVDQEITVWEQQAELDRLIAARNYWSGQMDDPEADLTYAINQVNERKERINSLLVKRRVWEGQILRSIRPSALVNPGRLAELQSALLSDSDEAFGAMTHLRLLLEELLEAIVVKPLEKRTGPRFDYSRVVMVWREDTAQAVEEGAELDRPAPA